MSVSYWYFRSKCFTGFLSFSSKLIFDQDKMILLYININAECKQAENGLIYLHEISTTLKPPELYICNWIIATRFPCGRGSCDFIPMYFSFFIFTKIKLTTKIFINVIRVFFFIHSFIHSQLWKKLQSFCVAYHKPIFTKKGRKKLLLAQI